MEWREWNICRSLHLITTHTKTFIKLIKRLDIKDAYKPEDQSFY